VRLIVLWWGEAMKNRAIMVIGALLIIIAAVVIARKPNVGIDNNEISLNFSGEDLKRLEDQISVLEYDDLEGLNISTSLDFSSIDLDELGNALESLSFEDLEGLIEN
jgi:hypothetical protein